MAEMPITAKQKFQDNVTDEIDSIPNYNLQAKRSKVRKDLKEKEYKSAAKPENFFQAILEKEKLVLQKLTKAKEPLADNAQENFAVGIPRILVPEKAPDIMEGQQL